MSKTVLWAVVGILLIVVVALGVWLAYGYRQDMRAARARVAAGQVIDTAAGPLEYAERGSGPPALVIHGAAGGFDQGLLIGEMLIPDGYRMIAPSRFGYLNARIPEDASLEAQADAYAALLDALEVEGPVPVFAFSAGGPSGLTFAMRYPERTSALVMLSAISFTEPPGDEARSSLETAINRLVSSDFLFWFATNFATGRVAALLGVPPAAQERLDPAGWASVEQVLDALLPMSARLPGIAVDQSRHLPPEAPLQSITAPTLAVHAQDDALVPFANGEHTAGSINGAELVPIAYGGHFLAGHGPEVQAEVRAFLLEAGIAPEE